MGKKRESVPQVFARALCEAHDVVQTMEDAEERSLLQQNNGQLYYAYIWLLQTAYPDDGRWLV